MKLHSILLSLAFLTLCVWSCGNNNNNMNSQTSPIDTIDGNKMDCMLCDAELEYHDSVENCRCAICGNLYESNVWCKNHHFVCDSCHSGNAADLILSVCRRTQSKNPIEIATGLMDHPSVHMHGPEHHILVGAVLLAAYKNAGGEVDLEKGLNEMRRRGEQVPGGACGSWGACGAATSTGMFMSIITGNSPLKEQEWRHSNHCTACALNSVSEHGGPRCCKRDSFLSIVEAVRLTEEYTGIKMELPKQIECRYSHLNNTCLGDKCPFHVE